MPLYEYQCHACGRQHERLVRLSDSPLPCIHCGNEDVVRILSLCAVSTSTTRQIALSSGRRAASRVQREKGDAEHEEMVHHHQR